MDWLSSWICFFFVRLLDYNLPTLCQLIKIEDMPVRLPLISIQFSYFFFCSNDKTWIKLIGFLILSQLVIPWINSSSQSALLISCCCLILILFTFPLFVKREIYTLLFVPSLSELPWWLKTLKRLPAMRETWVWFLGRMIPWRRTWQSTPALLPGKSHGRRSLIGYSPWGRKESDKTERLHFHFHLSDLNNWKLSIFSFFSLSSFMYLGLLYFFQKIS